MDRRVTGILALAAAFACGYFFAGDRLTSAFQLATTSNAKSSPYLTATVDRGDVVQTVTVSGALNALVTVEVGTQLSGRVAKLFVDFNDEVRQGQPLAELDRATFEAKLAETQAATEMANAAVKIQEARLERARIDFADREAQRAVLQARLDNARVRFEAAESAFQRAAMLHQSGTSSVSILEQARTERDSASALLREAEAIIAAHEYSVSGARIDLVRADAELLNARASVPRYEAVERSAQIDLERTTILSPVDGVVVGRNINEGQTVAASLEAPTLFTIAGDLREMEIYARVDESEIGKIKVGQKAVFTVDAHPGQRFAAIVSAVRKAPEIIQNVVAYTVVLRTGNPDDLLLPGMTAVVHIAVSEAEAVIRVPLASTRFQPEDVAERADRSGSGIAAGSPAVVWKIGPEDEPLAVPIGLGQDDGVYAVLLDGDLEEGQEVIVGNVIEPEPTRLFGIRFGF